MALAKWFLAAAVAPLASVVSTMNILLKRIGPLCIAGRLVRIE